jgi:hypothetical protein
MANNLNFGGAEAILVRDTGIANAVQGFVTKEITQGANVVGLPTTIFFTLDKRVVTPQEVAFTVYEAILNLSIETGITSSLNLEMNPLLSLISDTSLGEIGNLDLLTQINLSAIKNIALTTEMIIELTNLLAVNQIISTQIALEIISTMSLSTDNQINTEAFLDIMSSVNLEMDTQISFDSDLTVPIEVLLELNIDVTLFSESSYGLLRLINFLYMKNFHKIIG